MKTLRPLLSLFAAAALTLQSQAMTIGYYDSSRESWGFSGGGPYLSQAAQYLVAQGHTLVATNNVNDAFLSGVDAFYTGLINSVSASEITAMQNFVDVKGGFLFIQTDYDSSSWTPPANQILANWGITVGGVYSNDSGHTTVGSSSWVTDPNVVTGFIGSAHSTITSAPGNFEVLAKDDQGRSILGVFDAGAGRSSDVLIATDINFFDNSVGWTDARNRALWANIWAGAATQIDNGGSRVPDSGATLLLLGIGSMALAFRARRR